VIIVNFMSYIAKHVFVFQVSDLAGYASLMLDQNVKSKRNLPVSTLGVKKQRRSPATGHAIQPA